MEDWFPGEWERDQPTHARSVIPVKAWRGFISVLIGRIVLHWLCEELDTKYYYFFVSLGDVLFGSLSLLLRLTENQPAEFNIS